MRSTLTREDYLDWRQSYSERLWGGRREDDRLLAHLILHHNPEHTECEMSYPYFGRTEERDLAEHRDQVERKAELDPDRAKAAALAHIAAIRAGKVKRG